LGATRLNWIEEVQTLEHPPICVSRADLPFVRPFPPPAGTATQEGPSGIRFDFNDGCRVTLPPGDWHVCLRDDDTGNALFETSIAEGYVASTKKYFVRFEVLVWSKVALARNSGAAPLLHHVFDATGKNILVQLPVGTLGDTIAWMPYVAEFQRRHRCRLTCAMSDKLIPLFVDAYREIEFVTHEQVKPDRYYATYNLGLFFDDEDRVHQPCDFRLVGLHRTAGYILGLDPREEPPHIKLKDDSRPIDEPYVCIAVQSSTQCKYWNNPEGWHNVIAFCKAAGYRVVCIDQKRVHGTGMTWNHIPHGVDDETGDRPIVERARWLKHAAFFVGLSSGLSWLAWAMRVPVVMISGFSHPDNEFHTPYRVINYHVCNSCWNDVRVRFDHHDFMWCPKHHGTSRQFECTRLLESKQVIDAIRAIPGAIR
jgi:autotransporter strand-loop-strand O-heptosyltransferase